MTICLIAAVLLVGTAQLLIFTKWRYAKVISGVCLLSGAAVVLGAVLSSFGELMEIWSRQQMIVLLVIGGAAAVAGIAAIIVSIRCLPRTKIRGQECDVYDEEEKK